MPSMAHSFGQRSAHHDRSCTPHHLRTRQTAAMPQLSLMHPRNGSCRPDIRLCHTHTCWTQGKLIASSQPVHHSVRPYAAPACTSSSLPPARPAGTKSSRRILAPRPLLRVAVQGCSQPRPEQNDGYDHLSGRRPNHPAPSRGTHRQSGLDGGGGGCALFAMRTDFAMCTLRAFASPAPRGRTR
jgi:hypothetical protein